MKRGGDAIGYTGGAPRNQDAHGGDALPDEDAAEGRHGNGAQRSPTISRVCWISSACGR